MNISKHRIQLDIYSVTKWGITILIQFSQVLIAYDSYNTESRLMNSHHIFFFFYNLLSVLYYSLNSQGIVVY